MRRSSFGLMSGMAAAVVAAAFLHPAPPASPRPGFSKVKRRRYGKQADRSRKEYLLKGIRP
jgi:hypothetical protein